MLSQDPVTSFRYHSDQLLHLFSQTIHDKEQQTKRGRDNKCWE